MSKGLRHAVTVRFNDEEMRRLEDLAERYHVSSATVLRWALQALADHVKANGGKITLPLDFSSYDFKKAAE